ncbi:hypothetical protein ACSAZL_00735 [Methanosarcina sp. T3]|uniref:hypothetical protein n=1 Tax=Methanosarcina sp. T3 TaxID=3439062 RepID=UPI003F82715C
MYVLTYKIKKFSLVEIDSGKNEEAFFSLNPGEGLLGGSCRELKAWFLGDHQRSAGQNNIKKI